MKQCAIPDFKDPSPAYGFLTPQELKTRIRLFRIMNSQKLVAWGSRCIKTFQSVSFLYNWFVKRSVFKIFCGGETIKSCFRAMLALQRHGIGTIPDYSVESANSEANIRKAVAEIKKTILLAACNPQMVPLTVFKISGLEKKERLIQLNRKIVEKSGFAPQEEKHLHSLMQHVDSLCSFAHKHKIPIMIDAEESAIQDLIDYIARLMVDKYNKEAATIINTYQMYRKDGLQRLRESIQHCTQNNLYLGVKLVRGAYMEMERKEASAKGYPDPIHESKQHTDDSYSQGMVLCLDNIERITLVAGTHNTDSIRLLINEMNARQISCDDKRIYIAQLYGMGDMISYNLSKHGFNVAKYLPFGPVSEVMPYLMRRAQENSAAQGMTSTELQMLYLEKERRKNLLEALGTCIELPFQHKKTG